MAVVIVLIPVAFIIICLGIVKEIIKGVFPWFEKFLFASLFGLWIYVLIRAFSYYGPGFDSAGGGLFGLMVPFIVFMVISVFYWGVVLVCKLFWIPFDFIHSLVESEDPKDRVVKVEKRSDEEGNEK